MKDFLKIFLVLSFIGIYSYSCKKDAASTSVDLGYNYLPDEVGRYIIYEVDSISYDDVLPRPPIITRYLLKEVIASTFVDNTGKPALKIERYYKMYNDSVSYDSIAWTGPRVWSANKSSTDFQKFEENVRFIRLVFPVKEGKQWNGNSFNTLGEKEYEIISVDEEETINSIGFDSVVTIKQFEQINIIESRFETEKYARNVGLIYKQRDSLYLHQHDANDSPPFDDSTGFTFRQKIVSYGK
jgi:hypothetical protein